MWRTTNSYRFLWRMSTKGDSNRSRFLMDGGMLPGSSTKYSTSTRMVQYKGEASNRFDLTINQRFRLRIR